MTLIRFFGVRERGNLLHLLLINDRALVSVLFPLPEARIFADCYSLSVPV